jgi:rhodanese-related sulfurtransferase
MKRMRASVLLLVAVLTAAPAAAGNMTKKALLKRAEQSVEHVDVERALELWKRGEHVFLDCREPRAYRCGHAPGAVLLPRGDLELRIREVVPDKATPVVVYCRSGERAALAARTLEAMGYENVVNMRRGWRGWNRAWCPVE